MQIILAYQRPYQGLRDATNFIDDQRRGSTVAGYDSNSLTSNLCINYVLETNKSPPSMQNSIFISSIKMKSSNPVKPLEPSFLVNQLNNGSDPISYQPLLKGEYNIGIM